MKKVLFLTLMISSFLFGKNIKTVEVLKRLEDSNWVLVDTRDTNEYNGWNLSNLKKNGHIVGAKDFSYKWLDKKYLSTKNKEILKERIAGKGITLEKNIILYGTDVDNIEKVSNYFKSQGLENVFKYNLNENLDYEKLPFNSYENYEMLVPASWLKEKLDKKEVKVYEASWGSIKDAVVYLAGHIPGAPHINTDSVEPPPAWMINSDENLIKFAEEMGISKDDNIVLYGDDVMASYRLAIILKYLGVKDVRVLNGGLDAWKNAGYKTEMGVTKPTPIKEFGSKVPLKKSLIVNEAETKEILKDDKKSKVLVDIRSYNERIGKESGYSYWDKKGRIPGSVWGKSGTISVTLEDYRNVDNTMRNGYEILTMWKKLGIDKNKELTFFCGSGWRAAEVLFYSEVMGMKKNSLYSDGWIGWSTNSNNKIETGKEE
ncbi:rhodanese-like domain-containing protein [Cetobacterium sp.]|uniref:rhodanese-like domain-containing protein n=1 Tax=Cetobacterium sp. TaxID=2071632 RepID=UPI003F38090C